MYALVTEAIAHDRHADLLRAAGQARRARLATRHGAARSTRLRIHATPGSRRYAVASPA